MRTSKTGSLFFIKKILCLTLCILIEFIAVFSYFNVEAAQLPLNTSLKQDLRNVLIQRGIITENGLSDEFFDFLFPDREFYGIGEYSQAISDAALEKLGITINAAIAVTEKGEYVYSESLVDVLRQLFDEYLSEHPEVIDVVWVPVITEKNLKASWFDSLPSYNRSVEVVREHGLVGFRREVASGGVVYPPAYPLSIQFNYTDLNGYFPVYIDLSDTVYVDHFNESFINGVTYLTNSFGSETTTPLLTGNGWILTQNGVVTYPIQYVLKDGVWTNSFNFGHKNYYSFVLNPFYAGVVNYSSYTD
ncbi:MAG: hypothetical protein K2I07_00160, partial [Lachnospiraceae bacterium]|nr:hypothetical protein [Lachnospiraceae bacterium]